MRALRPVDLARAAGVSTQQVRRYEALGVIPPAPRSPSGYRRYSTEHLDAMVTARLLVAGYGPETGVRVMWHLQAGRPERAFAMADRAHLTLHQTRRRTLETLNALRTVTDRPDPLATRRQLRGGIRIGDAAATVGVPVSTLRHWEEEGLLNPRRDRESRYRSYDTDQLRRVQVIALLRESKYGLPAIREVIEQLAAGDLDAAMLAAQRRLAEINAQSLQCARATAALWEHHNRRLLASRSSDARDPPDVL